MSSLVLLPCTQADLIGLGLKKLDPSAFKSADYAHMSTSQLQHLLLKVALSAQPSCRNS